MEVLLIAQMLGKRVFAACSAKLKPFLLQVVKPKSMGISIDDFGTVVIYIHQEA